MTVEQCYSLVNDLIKEGVGAQSQTVKSIDGLVSFGESIVSESAQTDLFYNKLTDRFGRTWIKYRRYLADNKDSIMKTPMDFGMILQKVQTLHLGEMEANSSYVDQTNPFSTAKDTTSIAQTLFKAFGTFQTKVKLIYKTQLNGAFTNPTAFGAFCDMIFNDMYNSMEVAVENLTKLAKASMMAKALSGNGQTKRNLLAEYKTANPDATITASNCMTDVDFLKFASREILMVTKRFKRMSRVFNVEGADRFTPEDAMEVEVLDAFATATASYLDADTYHKELVALPKYREVSSWQSDSDFTFDEISKIDVSTGTGADTIEYTQGGIIACVYDRDACGVMIERPRTVSMYNNMQEIENVAYKLDWGTFVDSSENCVCLFIADADIDNGGSANSSVQTDTRTLKANLKKIANA